MFRDWARCGLAVALLYSRVDVVIAIPHTVHCAGCVSEARKPGLRTQKPRMLEGAQGWEGPGTRHAARVVANQPRLARLPALALQSFQVRLRALEPESERVGSSSAAGTWALGLFALWSEGSDGPKYALRDNTSH